MIVVTHLLLVSLSPRCPRPAGGGNAWPPFDGYIGIAVRWQARRPHTGGWHLVGSDASVALPRGAAHSRCHSQKRSVSNRGSPPACLGGEGIGPSSGNGHRRVASWTTDSQVLRTWVSLDAHSPKTINLGPRSSSMVYSSICHSKSMIVHRSSVTRLRSGLQIRNV